jgi:hypothetical protein
MKIRETHELGILLEVRQLSKIAAMEGAWRPTRVSYGIPQYDGSAQEPRSRSSYLESGNRLAPHRVLYAAEHECMSILKGTWQRKVAALTELDTRGGHSNPSFYGDGVPEFDATRLQLQAAPLKHPSQRYSLYPGSSSQARPSGPTHGLVAPNFHTNEYTGGFVGTSQQEPQIIQHSSMGSMVTQCVQSFQENIVDPPGQSHRSSQPVHASSSYSPRSGSTPPQATSSHTVAGSQQLVRSTADVQHTNGSSTDTDFQIIHHDALSEQSTVAASMSTRVGSVHQHGTQTKYHCDLEHCSERTFGRVKDLTRHYHACHTDEVLWCPFNDCARSNVKPFPKARKDKLKEHCRNIHGYDYSG